MFDTNFPAKLPFGQPGLYFLLPSVFFGCPKKSPARFARRLSQGNTKRKFGRLEPGYSKFTNILCGLKKHGGHYFVHSVSCSFRCILFKLICIIFQSTANGYENIPR